MAIRFRLSSLQKEALAEFCSTFILVIFGVGSIAQMVLSEWKFGNFFSVNFSWGIGVTLGCYWAGGISGAHMNPAVTLAFAVTRRLAWKKVPVYWAAQMVGSFVASACVYGVYYDALSAFDGGRRQVLGPKGTAGIWATYPKPFLSIASGIADQVLGTSLLVSCIFAITDKNNNSPDQGVAPVVIGLVVFVIGATFGFNCGYAINPARDLGPRCFTAIAGWGVEVFTAANNWWWVPVVGGFLGGVIGGLIYVCFIGMHLSSDSGGETGYQLENIITTKAEFTTNDSEMGKGNVAFSDVVVANVK
ncbi:Aquaporin-9 [Acropora cervicornis]|uniref:Aquaporin-9 n=1 Tax=Acropora cervicornis TaxID=6130 RepID=A0AAD9QWP0_ACRCE|nr:Aquaporin-9 [Acropora cervicornis]